MVLRHWLAVAAGILLSACANSHESEMYSTASALTKLTAHVDASVLFSPVGETSSDQALLAKAFEDNPTLQSPLGALSLHLQRGTKGVVLMVCTSDGTTVLFEDLSCTPGIDRHHWRDEPVVRARLG